MPVTYTMQARENLSPDLVAQVEAEIALGTGVTLVDIAPSQFYSGLCYDRENRTIVYSLCVVDDPGVNPKTNDTGVPLWSGISTIDVDATYDAYAYRNFSIMTRGLDDDVVTRFDVWSPTATVPAGIGPSDGTALRFTASDYSTQQIVKLVDPRTRNVWSHHIGEFVDPDTSESYTCFVYEFRHSEDYAQTISPYIPNGNRHMELGGMTDDWVLIGDLQKSGAGYSWQFLPRERQADEVAADYLLSYAEVTEPTPLSEGSQRWAFDSDGNRWSVAWRTAVNSFSLWKLAPPPVVVNPAAAPTLTDETPWGATDGPNTDSADFYVTNSKGQNAKVIVMHLPETSTLAILRKVFPADKKTGATNDPADFGVNVTYVDLPGLTYASYPMFSSGYMDADWNEQATIPTTGYAIVDFFEADQIDLAYHSYTFTNAIYDERWYFFSVIQIAEGALTSSYPDAGSAAGLIAAGTYIVAARYRFTPGQAPELVAFNGLDAIPEQGWDDNPDYDAYADYIASVQSGRRSIVRYSISTATDPNAPSYYDSGIWDAATSSWWWSGNTNAFARFDPTMWQRYDPSSLVERSPFLRLTLAAAARALVSVWCAVLPRVTPLTPILDENGQPILDEDGQKIYGSVI